MQYMSMRMSIFLVALAFVVIGGVLLDRSAQMSEWTDSTRAEQTQSWPEPTDIHGPAYDAYNARWFKEMDSLRTAKWPLFDAGSGLIAFGITLVVAVLTLGIRRRDDVLVLTSPKRRWMIFAICTFAWFGFWADKFVWLIQNQTRWEYPMWADSIGIPMFEFAILAVVGWITLSVIGWFLVLRRTKLPASLWIWRKDSSLRSWAFTILTTLSVCVAAVDFSDSMRFGPYTGIPADLLWTYATLVVRAAATSQQLRPGLNSPRTA